MRFRGYRGTMSKYEKYFWEICILSWMGSAILARTLCCFFFSLVAIVGRELSPRNAGISAPFMQGNFQTCAGACPDELTNAKNE